MLPTLQNVQQRDRAEVVRHAAEDAIEKITEDDDDDEADNPAAGAIPPRPAAGVSIKRPGPASR
jgi:hypothetical protein